MASGTVVDLFYDLGHQPVIPSQPLGVHKSPEIRVRFPFIGSVQQIGKHLLPNFPALVFIRHPKVCRNIQPIGVFPENIPAKAMNGGYFCQEQPLHLFLQVLISRFLRNALAQLRGNFSPKLRCRRLGISNDQKVVQVGGGFLIRKIGHQPIHQHLGFAGAGGGGDQQLSAPIMYRQCLLGCQLIRHGRFPPFPLPPRTAGQSLPYSCAAR